MAISFVVTNALQIALDLANRSSLAVMTLGGRVRPESYAEVDAWALARLATLRFDVVFVGTNAIDISWGLSTPDPAGAAVKGAILASAQRIVLLADHTKLGSSAACRYASLSQVDLLVTDDGVDRSAVKEIRANGTEVRIGSPLS